MLKALPPEVGSGSGGLLSMLTGGGGLGALAEMLGGSGPGGLLSGIFGSGLSAITATLDRKLGFKVSPLIALAAPFVLNAIRKMMAEQKLDATGVLKALHGEQEAFASRGGEAAQAVREALSAGDAAAAIKAKYSAEQWLKLRMAPIAAAELVMMASPSGAVGSIKELTAAGGALSAAVKTAAPTSLIGLVFDVDLKLDELTALRKGKSEAIGKIKDAMAAVLANNPGEAPSYAKLLIEVATKTAEASKEGGFLGIGGTLVSPEEQAAIDELKSLVGVK
jgi:hypothetical protein